MTIFNTKKKLLSFIILSTLTFGCGIKDRLQEKPVITYVEKPPELLWQDANRYFSRQ